ncbi:phenylalanine--tRNA ligase subunit beta [Patescibacteria group bacterium]|nr:phenylalanine--tRNA ligase subunit beta [Patescibacteria group bacterium]MBU4367723.1 phenylalanine--tRNA ligase subunit beta [Patescibacteria group bacterium]MBU4461827.1 phenylalanine--tRNA ligase subunit beta [Patescibacteria group bacterium]MCG2700042.1 phenylalanine--tRNA ligase subunit beta [Candidatus Parcubacteria bacterium]
MKFSYNWLQSFFKEKLPKPEKLADILTMHSFEVESVVKKGNDFILDIDILPNRSQDCFSYQGLAREVGALLNKKPKKLEQEKLLVEKGGLEPVKIEVRSSSIIPRYTAILIEGIKIKKSPDWLKNNLEAVGIRSINNIVDLTNWIMLETGQPLHAFDYDKIFGKKMVVRMARAGERVITLDEKTHKLDDGAIIIEDQERLIDLAGIMGGKVSEVTNETKSIILQAANFDRRSIYITAKKLNQKTQASDIYSQGVDPNLTKPALERAYFLLNKLGGGKIRQVVDIYPKKIKSRKIKINIGYFSSLLGREIPVKRITDILESLEFKVKQIKSDLIVEIPTFRADINLGEDLVEEVGRVYGYEAIKPFFPVSSLIPPKRNINLFWENKAKDALKEAGFNEVYNYSFFGDKEAESFGYNPQELIEIKNPANIEQKYLRATLIPNLLKNVQKNQDLNFKEISIFELGKIFIKKGLAEKRMLSGLVSTIQNKKNEGFYEVKGVVETLLNKLGVADVWYDEFKATPEDTKNTIWNRKKCAEIKSSQEEIGFLGEITQTIRKKLEVPENVFVFDLDFEKLSKLASEEQEYRPISQYPSAIRDLAILVPQNVKVDDVLNIMEQAGGKLVIDIDLFDMYEGENLPDGKKNLAFHIIYQAEDRTLKSNEINKLHQKIVKALEKNPEWEVRC